MTYSCAVFAAPDTTLEAAQAAKYELVCRKLGLRPGHAAARRRLRLGRHGHARGRASTACTRSASRSRRARPSGRASAVREAGLADRVEIRVQDYRDVVDGPFDAISSIGMFEHVGAAKLDEYFTRLFALLRPGGRLLNHGIAKRPEPAAPRFAHRGFIDRYVFPDGELHEVGSVVSRVQQRGVRGPQRRGPARALRADAAALGREPRGALGRSGAPGRAGPGPGLAALHGRVGVNFEAERTRSTRCSRCATTPDGRSDMPRRPDWEPYG